VAAEQEARERLGRSNNAIKQAAEGLGSLAEASRSLARQIDQIYKLAGGLVEG
jgi:hypothetical protein